MKNMEHYYKVLSRVDGMLTFAESKIGFIVAYAGLLLSVLGGQADRIQSLLHSPKQFVGYITLILLFVIIINLIFLLIYIGKVLFPNLESSSHISMAYFSDISKLAEEDFLKTAKSRSEKDIVDDVLSEIHAVSNIVNQKFINIKLATKLLYPFTVLWVLVITMVILFSTSVK